MTTECFYNHFSQDSATGPGKWVARIFSEKIFNYAGIEPASAVLEIGPGRGRLCGCLSWKRR